MNKNGKILKELKRDEEGFALLGDIVSIIVRTIIGETGILAAVASCFGG